MLWNSPLEGQNELSPIIYPYSSTFILEAPLIKTNQGNDHEARLSNGESKTLYYGVSRPNC